MPTAVVTARAAAAAAAPAATRAAVAAQPQQRVPSAASLSASSSVSTSSASASAFGARAVNWVTGDAVVPLAAWPAVGAVCEAYATAFCSAAPLPSAFARAVQLGSGGGSGGSGGSSGGVGAAAAAAATLAAAATTPSIIVPQRLVALVMQGERVASGSATSLPTLRNTVDYLAADHAGRLCAASLLGVCLSASMEDAVDAAMGLFAPHATRDACEPLAVVAAAAAVLRQLRGLGAVSLDEFGDLLSACLRAQSVAAEAAQLLPRLGRLRVDEVLPFVLQQEGVRDEMRVALLGVAFALLLRGDLVAINAVCELFGDVPAGPGGAGSAAAPGGGLDSRFAVPLVHAVCAALICAGDSLQAVPERWRSAIVSPVPLSLMAARAFATLDAGADAAAAAAAARETSPSSPGGAVIVTGAHVLASVSSSSDSSSGAIVRSRTGSSDQLPGRAGNGGGNGGVLRESSASPVLWPTRAGAAGADGGAAHAGMQHQGLTHVTRYRSHLDSADSVESSVLSVHASLTSAGGLLPAPPAGAFAAVPPRAAAPLHSSPGAHVHVVLPPAAPDVFSSGTMRSRRSDASSRSSVSDGAGGTSGSGVVRRASSPPPRVRSTNAVVGQAGVRALGPPAGSASAALLAQPLVSQHQQQQQQQQQQLADGGAAVWSRPRGASVATLDDLRQRTQSSPVLRGASPPAVPSDGLVRIGGVSPLATASAYDIHSVGADGTQRWLRGRGSPVAGAAVPDHAAAAAMANGGHATGKQSAAAAVAAEDSRPRFVPRHLLHVSPSGTASLPVSPAAPPPPPPAAANDSYAPPRRHSMSAGGAALQQQVSATGRVAPPQPPRTATALVGELPSASRRASLPEYRPADPDTPDRDGRAVRRTTSPRPRVRSSTALAHAPLSSAAQAALFR